MFLALSTHTLDAWHRQPLSVSVLSGAALLLVYERLWQEASATALRNNSASVQGRQSFYISKAALLEVLGVILTVSGLVTCVLYLTGVMTAYGWGHVVNMALPAAAGFAVFGVGILAVAWRENHVSLFAVSPWLPVVAGVAVVTRYTVVVPGITCAGTQAYRTKHSSRGSQYPE